MKKFFALLFYCIYFLNYVTIVSAQDTTGIESEIRKQPETDAEIISKSRTLLSKFVATGNFTQVTRILNFLTQKYEHSGQIPLWPFERWYIYFWTDKSDMFLKEVINYKQIFKSYDEKVSPQDTLVEHQLASFTAANTPQLLLHLDSSVTNPEHRHFMVLAIKYMQRLDLATISREELNQEARAFLSLYPQSLFKDYIQEYIIVEYHLSKGGVGLNIGSGFSALSGNIANTFSNSVPFEYGIDMAYKQVYFGFDLSIGPNRVLHQFYFDGEWVHGRRTTLVTAGIFLGYDLASIGQALYERNSFRCIPYIAFGAVEFSAGTSEKPDYRSLDIATTTFGIKTDIKITRRKVKKYASAPALEYSYFYIRLDPSINLLLPDEQQAMFAGSLFNFSVHLGAFARVVKQVTYN